MKKLIAIIGIGLLTAGCTTAMLRMPGGVSILQPKDVSLRDLEYRVERAGQIITYLKVGEYDSNANVAAIKAQTDLVKGVIDSAIKAALSGATP